jgi:hypothetical protein
MKPILTLLVVGLVLGGCTTSSPPPRRAVQVDPESPAGRAAAPDSNLHRQDVAGIRLRDPYTISVQRLAQGGFEVKDQPSLMDVERSTGAQLIAFRDVPYARMPSLAPSEMLAIRYCYGRVVSMDLRTPLDDAGLARARDDDAANMPASMRIESQSKEREVRKYSTNRLSGIHLVYGINRQRSQFHPHERWIMLYDQNWCLVEESKRRF